MCEESMNTIFRFHVFVRLQEPNLGAEAPEINEKQSKYVPVKFNEYHSVFKFCASPGANIGEILPLYIKS